MKFLKQVKYEIKNILSSKFLLIIGILVVAASVLIPVGTLILSKLNANGGGGVIRPMPIEKAYAIKMAGGAYYGGGDGTQESVTVDGIVITSDNPLYWQIKGDMDEMKQVEGDKTRFSTPEALDLYLNLLDTEIHYYLRFAQSITNPQDYRMELAWLSIDSLYEKFIFEHIDVPETVLLEAVANRKGLDEQTLRKKYLDLTAEQRLAAVGKAEDMLDQLFNIVESNDFDAYITLRTQQYNKQISDYESTIELLNQNIKDNPDQEEVLGQQIEQMQKEITNIKETSIQVLEIRREKHIVPGEDTWQNNALNDMVNYRNQILYTTIMKEDQFNQDPYNKQQYGSYPRYLEKMQQQINSYNNIVKIAQNSINAGKPDMKYVRSSSRGRSTGFLYYSIFVALFGAMVGGWLIASEFQQGTVRLLMIRPKTRIKILMAKYTGALLVLLGMYVAGMALNFLVNGICFGFSDYGFPNYTISGEIGFAAFYLPRLVGSAVIIVFGFSIAFMMSVLARNSAVSIAVPIILFVGCVIATFISMYNIKLDWLAATPIPYTLLPILFIPDSVLLMAAQQVGTVYSIPMGIGYLLGLSVVAMAAATLVFKKRDITN